MNRLFQKLFGKKSFLKPKSHSPGKTRLIFERLEAREMFTGAGDAIIAGFYASLGGENGGLGRPVDQAPVMAADNRGEHQYFEKGSIYWSQETGVHFLVGSIRQEYRDLGGDSPGFLPDKQRSIYHRRGWAVCAL